jgi:predicted ATP-dependent endonuclease of OLD family
MVNPEDKTAEPFQLVSLKIQYFRSVYEASVDDMGRLTVITGGNDVGKSNILRALNLFFNEKTDNETPLQFETDFSHARAEAGLKKKAGPEKTRFDKTISVECQFNSAPTWATIPEGVKRVVVKKTWTPNASKATQRHWFRKKYKKNGKEGLYEVKNPNFPVSTWMNRYKFIYLPACKDQQTITDFILDLVKERISRSAVEKFYRESLFDGKGSILPNLPNEPIMELLPPEDLGFLVEQSIPKSKRVKAEGMDFKTSLFHRGQGIQVQYLLLLLKQVLEHEDHKKRATYYVVGFEEPEAFLEPLNTKKLFDDILALVSAPKQAQFIVTSHSPIFYAYAIPEAGKEPSKTPITLHHCSAAQHGDSEHKKTEIKQIKTEDDLEEVDAALGSNLAMARAFQKEQAGRKKLEKQIATLEAQLQQSNCLLLLVEGKNDKTIFDKLFEQEINDQKLQIVALGGKDDLDKKLRTFVKTKSPDKPVLVVLDSDAAGKAKPKIKAKTKEASVFVFSAEATNELGKVEKTKGNCITGLECYYPDPIVTEIVGKLKGCQNDFKGTKIPNAAAIQKHLDSAKEGLAEAFVSAWDDYKDDLNPELQRLREEVQGILDGVNPKQGE